MPSTFVISGLLAMLLGALRGADLISPWWWWIAVLIMAMHNPWESRYQLPSTIWRTLKFSCLQLLVTLGVYFLFSLPIAYLVLTATFAVPNPFRKPIWSH